MDDEKNVEMLIRFKYSWRTLVLKQKRLQGMTRHHWNDINGAFVNTVVYFRDGRISFQHIRMGAGVVVS